MTHHARKWANKQQQAEYERGDLGEICPMIRCPEVAVRGYIAMLRREADAIWWVSTALSSDAQGPISCNRMCR